ncbi:hypothetical protein [Xenorhabdus innexi]|uniref:Secreted protein n=1 Tax=Xenorhabdus innexi TaxID=290109 RepID=A0A1N6MZI5_9GAMM|nr:hypothetical protein [Xenorhabdus innexi]PHM37937.1 hypothetical protein Xinn_00746 [Xenorhabdus innexi]SIP74217.1 exported hypothetical protein [Xenorhabdus innexi]
MNMMKKILSGVLILFMLNVFSAAYAHTDKIKSNTKEGATQVISKVSIGTTCTPTSNYKGYVDSVAIGYGGINKGEAIKNYIAITLVDQKRKNNEWYWTQYDANTDAGKSIQAIALYAAASGQKILAECVTSGDHQNIKSLWVGPDAW